VTGELALLDPRLRGVEDHDLAPIRRSRLDRLRAAAASGAGPHSTIPRPEPRPDRAQRLAADVGGALMDTPQRPIVVVERHLPLEARLEGLRWLPEPVDPDLPLVLIDTETTGLGTGAGTLPFLVGIGTWQGDTFVTRQLLLPEQSDEAGYLTALAGLIPPDACLVSYNGRSFDWPLLVTRFRLHGRPPPAHAAHLDLLPLARVLWRHRLPDARLASVERAVCGVRRAHDLPGGLVPARYLDYLRSGHGGLLREVLDHNHQDVVSMALLLRILALDLAPASTTRRAPATVDPGDLGGLGRAYARRRRHQEALACFDAALERLTGFRDVPRFESVAMERARALTRLGLRAEAEGAWHAIALEGGRHAALAWLHVAKHREHDGRDVRAALAATERARAIAERGRLFGRRDRVVERDLARRVPRLRRRLAAAVA
jgi:DNA polymerase III epsilon subunit-like protein